MHIDTALDGKTHCNVYSKGKTVLGRELSNFSLSPFDHPVHGVFDSVEGYWYWLTRLDDRLRSVSGVEAKELGRSLPKVRSYDTSELSALFQYRITQALDAKLERHPDMMARLISSRLPFVHYYVGKQNGIYVGTVPDGSDFLMAHFTKVRQEKNPGVNFLEFDCAAATLPTNIRKERENTMQVSLF